MNNLLKNLLKDLLAESSSLETQIEIIKILNQYQESHPEDPDLLYSLASLLISKTQPFKPSQKKIIDIVGTGGDGYNTLNFSTLSAFLTARAGYPVAKHGGKSATSKTGSFDFLMGMEIDIPKTPEDAEKILEEKI